MSLSGLQLYSRLARYSTQPFKRITLTPPVTAYTRATATNYLITPTYSSPTSSHKISLPQGLTSQNRQVRPFHTSTPMRKYPYFSKSLKLLTPSSPKNELNELMHLLKDTPIDPYGSFSKNGIHYNLFMIVTDYENLEAFKELLHLFIYPKNLIDDEGFSILHFACQRGLFDIVKQIVKHSNMNGILAESYKGETPLYIAAVNTEYEILQFLLDTFRVIDNKTLQYLIDTIHQITFYPLINTIRNGTPRLLIKPVSIIPKLFASINNNDILLTMSLVQQLQKSQHISEDGSFIYDEYYYNLFMMAAAYDNLSIFLLLRQTFPKLPQDTDGNGRSLLQVAKIAGSKKIYTEIKIEENSQPTPFPSINIGAHLETIGIKMWSNPKPPKTKHPYYQPVSITPLPLSVEKAITAMILKKFPPTKKR
ncbi:hypothetical protein DID77_04905 [Candidatus Marinamargulisbacteria bacterium SCGC AG-439-L15]|nr:hypothetical protein DID77_04905 [Candidatus Marinamargulisbacteria bacterium SCGC AG-439-L15]